MAPAAPARVEARPIREVAILRTNNATNSICKLDTGDRLELKKNIVQLLLSSGQFTGLSYEKPQKHIQNFLEIIHTFILAGVSTDYVKLTLFYFSRLGEAKMWLHDELLNSMTS